MLEVSKGIRRVTHALPWALDHVHTYLLRAPDGWVVVDTGLGLRDAEERWESILGALDAPVVQIVVTHFHPDHVGAAAVVAELTGARVSQGELDYAQCERVWGNPDWEGEGRWLAEHGVPRSLAGSLVEEGKKTIPLVRYAANPEPLRPGDRLTAAGEDWEVLETPGHADGHLVLHGTRSRRLLAGDLLLAGITPNVGLWPGARPDPLGDYLASLERMITLAPIVAFAGHHDPIPAPAERAVEIREHHIARLDVALRALGAAPRTAFEVSLSIFGDGLSLHERDFAIAETLAHLERLRREGRVERVADDGAVSWQAAQASRSSRR